MAVEWVVLGLGASAAIAGWWYRRHRADPGPGGSRGLDWGRCFEGAGRGRVTRAADAQLRIDGARARWTLTARPGTLPVADLTVESDRLPLESRLYVAWGLDRPASEVRDWPSVEVRARGERPLVVRADAPFDVRAWLSAHEIDLLDLLRQTDSAGLELTLRGGYLRLRLPSARSAPGVPARVLEAVERLLPRSPDGRGEPPASDRL